MRVESLKTVCRVSFVGFRSGPYVRNTELRQETCTYTDQRRRIKVLHLSANMYNITVSCAEIHTPAGFVYVILSVIMNHINNPDCDQSWYLQDGRLIADPSDPQTLIDPVISVSSDRLVTSRCVNLIHEIICHSVGVTLKYQTAFRVFNGTDSFSGSTQTPESHQWWWISALIFIVLLLLICFLLRKKIFRCFQRSDSENRDPESGVQMKLRSDESDSPNQSESDSLRDPESGVQMKLRSDESDSLNQSESDSLRDPESGVQMKLRSDESDSLNQSESEQINGSMFRE